jgi:hypothetical protein
MEKNRMKDKMTKLIDEDYMRIKIIKEHMEKFEKLHDIIKFTRGMFTHGPHYGDMTYKLLLYMLDKQYICKDSSYVISNMMPCDDELINGLKKPSKETEHSELNSIIFHIYKYKLDKSLNYNDYELKNDIDEDKLLLHIIEFIQVILDELEPDVFENEGWGLKCFRVFFNHYTGYSTTSLEEVKEILLDDLENMFERLFVEENTDGEKSDDLNEFFDTYNLYNNLFGDNPKINIDCGVTIKSETSFDMFKGFKDLQKYIDVNKDDLVSIEVNGFDISNKMKDIAQCMNKLNNRQNERN